MAETYKVGLVGCGGIARGHAQLFQGHERTELVALADYRRDSVERFGEAHGVDRLFTDYREMLAAQELDIVCICTWPNTHAEITVAAARRGVKAVICEKPMCVDLAEADTMILACKKGGTKLVITHQRRFMPTSVAARRLIADSAIGKPTLVRRNGGGGLTNTHTHSIDFIRYILGDPATKWVIGQVERTTERYERGLAIEDLCMGLICFDGGARAIIESDIPPSDQPENTYVYGTEGMLDVDRKSIRLLTADSSGWQEVPAEGPEPRRAQLEEFVAYVDGETDHHRGEGASARASIEIMMAIFESARTRGLVEFPLKVRAYPLARMIEEGALPVTNPGRYDIRDPFWFDEERQAAREER